MRISDWSSDVCSSDLISVGGIIGNRRTFGTGLPGTDHLRHTHDLARNAFSRGFPQHGAELADDLQRLVDLHGAETIAAVIVEPMAGSTGVLLPPVGYLQRLRSEERRVGEEGVSTCRSGGSPYH